jgi:hypothetical protein
LDDTERGLQIIPARQVQDGFLCTRIELG